MNEVIKKPEPAVNDSKKKVKYGLLLMAAGVFVMVMDRTRLVAGVIIMGYAALQLLLYVVLSKRKYQKSYRQYEAELQNYEIQKQKEQKQLAALREQYKSTG